MKLSTSPSGSKASTACFQWEREGGRRGVRKTGEFLRRQELLVEDGRLSAEEVALEHDAQQRRRVNFPDKNSQ